jgi:hypothetical protein
MRTLILATVLTLPAILTGCGGTNYGVFATSTNLGIDADAKTGTVTLGYGRTEGFVGPGYPKNGTAPSVFGFIESDQSVFTPAVKQLYATGSAADLVTAVEDPPPPKPMPTDGTPKTMAFGTTTSIALRVSFTGGAPVPDSLSFGYKRSEASVIPVHPGEDGKPSRYVPTLAAIKMNSAADQGFNKTGLGVRQFFATGDAARNLAATPSIRNLIREEAKRAIGPGEREGQAVATTISQTIACIQRQPGALATDAARARWKRTVAAMVSAGIIREADRARYEGTASTEDIAVRLNGKLATAAEAEKFQTALGDGGKDCEA